MRGSLIVLEGCDRTGKTTQVALLVAALLERGIPCVSKRFPDRTTATGKVIDAYLQTGTTLDNHASHLLFSANRWEAQAEMERLLSEDTTVVVDRYFGSGVAYSAAKGLDFDWCLAPDQGLLKADLTFYLHASSEKASERADFGQERYEEPAFQKLVAVQYDRLRFGRYHWKTIDASKSIEEVHSQITLTVQHCVKAWWDAEGRCRSAPFRCNPSSTNSTFKEGYRHDISVAMEAIEHALIE